ncbi:hypothetical protein SNEBB_001915 [Seison nebaliae]|nr:hypothetical protein SNEBB_001915 [Seison nebaliae]
MTEELSLDGCSSVYDLEKMCLSVDQHLEVDISSNDISEELSNEQMIVTSCDDGEKEVKSYQLPTESSTSTTPTSSSTNCDDDTNDSIFAIKPSSIDMIKNEKENRTPQGYVNNKLLLSDNGTIRGIEGNVSENVQKYQDSIVNNHKKNIPRFLLNNDQLTMAITKAKELLKALKEEEKDKLVLYNSSLGIVRSQESRCKNLRNLLIHNSLKFDEKDCGMSLKCCQNIHDNVHNQLGLETLSSIDGNLSDDTSNKDNLDETDRRRSRSATENNNCAKKLLKEIKIRIYAEYLCRKNKKELLKQIVESEYYEKTVKMKESAFFKEIGQGKYFENVIALPLLFYGGLFLGNFDKIHNLCENGEFLEKIPNVKRIKFQEYCGKCGGHRWLPCNECSEYKSEIFFRFSYKMNTAIRKSVGVLNRVLKDSTGSAYIATSAVLHGGDVKEGGGSFAKREQALEDQHFKKLEREQLSALKKHHDDEIQHHEKVIQQHMDSIKRHRYKIYSLDDAAKKKKKDD